VPAECRGVGARTEDDALVMPEGHDEPTFDIPPEVAEIERACRG